MILDKSFGSLKKLATKINQVEIPSSEGLYLLELFLHEVFSKHRLVQTVDKDKFSIIRCKTAVFDLQIIFVKKKLKII